MVLLEEIKDFQKRLNALYHHLKIEEKKLFINEEELKTQKQDFWNDLKLAELIIKQINKAKFWVTGYNQVRLSIEDLSTLYDFFLEKEATEEELRQHFDQTKTFLIQMNNYYCNCLELDLKLLTG